jgi:hypothetical protein
MASTFVGPDLTETAEPGHEVCCAGARGLIRLGLDLVGDGGREKLDAVAPGVLGVEAALARERLVPGNRNAGGLEALGQVIQLRSREPQGWVRLARWREPALDADVELLGAQREPSASASPEHLRLLELRQADQLAEEAPGGRLATGRSGDLNVIELHAFPS